MNGAMEVTRHALPLFTQVSYLIASALFVLSLKWLSAPTTARRGVVAGELGMLLAIVGTLLLPNIQSFQWIIVTILIGTAIVLLTFLPLLALPGLPGRFHDFRELDLIDTIAARSEVLPPGLDLERLEQEEPRTANQEPPTILWNARWEYDKNPQAFFDALTELDRRGAEYRLIVAGEHIDPDEPAFLEARERYAPRTRWWAPLNQDGDSTISPL